MQLAAFTQKAAEKPAFTQVPIPPAFLQLLRSLHTQKAAYTRLRNATFIKAAFLSCVYAAFNTAA